MLTMVPGKGPSRQERREIERYAREGYTAVILDDSPHTGGTIFTAFDIARRAGFAIDKLKALIPAHPARPDWYKPLSDDMIVSLAPADWHKPSLLAPATAQVRLTEYFRAQGFDEVRVVESSRVAQLNQYLDDASPDARGARLKRIFEVHLAHGSSQREVRFVLAKSVGWGWLGYHAFLAGRGSRGSSRRSSVSATASCTWTGWRSELSDAEHERRRSSGPTHPPRMWRRASPPRSEAASAAGTDLQRQHNGLRLLEQGAQPGATARSSPTR